MRIAAASIILLSALVVIKGDAIWEKLWPQQFWQVKVLELEGYEKHCHWRLKSIEWELMKGRMELTIGVSEAEDKARCLGMDHDVCVAKAKERALLKLKSLAHEESQARSAYEETQRALQFAKQKLVSFSDQRGDSAGKVAFKEIL
ncbi:MAG: hypothetical protein A3E80_04190 [Chlamydiae bacterium RIFCSPHIGHO2_12_FULL_49_9]|nr:MAG: hypothetical protein A3E80_04190 [Chlamydiae bacterium RIFCSPHIGHO2_12_FULL_49_9]